MTSDTLPPGPSLHTIRINTASAYDVVIGKGLFPQEQERLLSLIGNRRIVVVADETTAELFLQKFMDHLPEQRSCSIVIPAGEAHKTRETKAYIEDSMLRSGHNRDSCIVALGGGMVCDIAGFTAATYCRGIPSVYIPTTLLAMVDASVGGKTAVNTPQGKNLIGAFHQPAGVFMDIENMYAQSEEAVNDGITEHLKHCLIACREELPRLRERYSRRAELPVHWFLHDAKFVEQSLARSVGIKKSFVEQDEYDLGARQALNFGHTLGHAIESASGYSLSHGHSIAVGMLLEGHLSMRLGLLSQADFTILQHSLAVCGVPLLIPSLQDKQALSAALQRDKKNQGGSVHVTLLEAAGRVCSGPARAVAWKDIAATLDWYAACSETASDDPSCS